MSRDRERRLRAWKLAASLTGGGGAVPAELGFSRAAGPDDFVKVLTNFPSITPAGTIVLLGTVTGIGSGKGTIARSFEGAGTRGVIFRFASTTQLECIAKDGGGVNRTATYTHGGSMVGSAGRWWAKWGPSASDTLLTCGYGATAGTPLTITGGIGVGTVATGSPDAALFDQDGTADRSVTGTGMLVVWLSEELTPTECNTLTATELLARGTVLMAPQPNVGVGNAVTGGSDIDPAAAITRTFSTPNSTTTGTHNDMSAALVTS